MRISLSRNAPKEGHSVGPLNLKTTINQQLKGLKKNQRTEAILATLETRKEKSGLLGGTTCPVFTVIGGCFPHMS